MYWLQPVASLPNTKSLILHYVNYSMKYNSLFNWHILNNLGRENNTLNRFLLLPRICLFIIKRER